MIKKTSLSNKSLIWFGLKSRDKFRQYQQDICMISFIAGNDYRIKLCPEVFINITWATSELIIYG